MLNGGSEPTAKQQAPQNAELLNRGIQQTVPIVIRTSKKDGSHPHACIRAPLLLLVVTQDLRGIISDTCAECVPGDCNHDLYHTKSLSGGQQCRIADNLLQDPNPEGDGMKSHQVATQKGWGKEGKSPHITGETQRNLGQAAGWGYLQSYK